MRDEDEAGRTKRGSLRSSGRACQRSEFDFIKRIRERAFRQRLRANSSDSSLIPHPSSLLQGIGDDAAILRQSARRETVITADLLVEGVDFRLTTTSPRLLGHKALAVSLSDVAAMGAPPRFALLSIGVPGSIWRTRFIDELYDGFFELADSYDVALVGGDLSRTPDRVVIDSIVLGEVRQGRAVLRSGARAGDHIFVTGSLGGAAAGLRLLESGARLMKRAARSNRARNLEAMMLRQLRPSPRVFWGATLGEKRLATAMIDISDGLSSDLAHLCSESRVGATIDAARIPVDPLINEMKDSNLDPLELALDGGEDFELLFTVRPRDLKRLPAEIDGVPITYIGDITREQNGLLISYRGHARTLNPQGYTHFSRPQP